MLRAAQVPSVLHSSCENAGPMHLTLRALYRRRLIVAESRTILYAFLISDILIHLIKNCLCPFLKNGPRYPLQYKLKINYKKFAPPPSFNE